MMERRTMVRLTTAALAGVALGVPVSLGGDPVVRKKWNFGWIREGDECRLVSAWWHPEGIEWGPEGWAEGEWSFSPGGMGVLVRARSEAEAGQYGGWVRVGSVTGAYLALDGFAPEVDRDSLFEELRKIPGLLREAIPTYGEIEWDNEGPGSVRIEKPEGNRKLHVSQIGPGGARVSVSGITVDDKTGVAEIPTPPGKGKISFAWM